MWQQYYILRSTKEFADSWAAFLRESRAVPSQTLYQHVTDIVFNHLIKEYFPTPSEPTQDTCTLTLDYSEKNALRYIAGCITRQAYHKLKDSRHKLKDEMNDVDPDKMKE